MAATVRQNGATHGREVAESATPHADATMGEASSDAITSVLR
jgi:hypothetical protein